MEGGRRAREILNVAGFGPALAALYWAVCCRPEWLPVAVSRHAALRVLAIVLVATLAAYACRRVVEAVLRLCGF